MFKLNVLFKKLHHKIKFYYHEMIISAINCFFKLTDCCAAGWQYSNYVDKQVLTRNS